MFTLLFLIGIFVLTIFFLGTVHNALRLVPKEKRIVPAWFCWFMLVPMVGYVFAWILLPFIIPKTFSQYLAGNTAALKLTGNLSILGLCTAIAMLFELVPGLHLLGFLMATVFTIFYWFKLIHLRDYFLKPLVKPMSELTQL